MKRGLLILLVTDLWANLAIGMLGPIYALFVKEIGGNILDASWAYASYAFATGVMILVLGHFTDKVTKKQWFLVVGYSLAAIGCLMYYFVYDQTMLLMTQIVLGFGSAALIPAYNVLYTRYLRPEKEASDWAKIEAMEFIVPAIAAIIGGYIANLWGFRVLFLVMLCVSLVSVAVTALLFREEAGNAEAQEC